MLRNEKLNDLYSSPNIIRVITSRKVRRAGHVTGTGGTEMHIQFWPESPRGRDRLKGTSRLEDNTKTELV